MIRSLIPFVLALAATAAAAQSNVTRIIVPFGAGGVQDILARAISAELGTALGRTVIVENRTGAGGTIGTASVAKAVPDGHTLILAAASHTINGSLYAKLPYDPLEDFTGVAHIGTVEYVLMIGAALPAKTVKEFVDYAKANPGKLNYTTAGSGTATHLSMAYFAGLAGIDMVHVPYKATNEAVNEVVAGRSHAVIAANIGALPFAKDARVRMLGVTSAKRSKFLPDLPTIAEAGVPGYEFDSWLGLLGPAGIPVSTVERINSAVGTLLKDPVILDRLAKQGIAPGALSPGAFNALLRADFAKMARVVKASGARID
ncbi:MAG TPA: tripartite tricarboxylate transporter substrate binding protein [Burkholderiales bacterium]|nr:tripartite tricarboxylate transporter substrate binding protein [Burkholderiales bacterium]